MSMKKDKTLKGRKGFTLMEVMVTVVIIAVLAAVAYPVFSKSINKARATEAVNLLEMVKSKQIKTFASRDQYVGLDALGKLTNGNESINGTQLIVNDKYYVSLNNDGACASVSYRKTAGADPLFTFSMGYEKSGLGCTGSDKICESFGGLVGPADSVCCTGDECECVGESCGGPVPTCDGTCTGTKPTCGAGYTGDYQCNYSTCQWENKCTAIPGWCDGQTRSCTGSGTNCKETCTGTTWGACVCEGVCTPGAEGTFGNCPGVCKDDGSGFQCKVGASSGEYFCADANTCKKLDNTCPDGSVQKQTCDDGVTHLTRTWSSRDGKWSCEFNKSACKCE